jgi:hypothetical protein
VAESAAQAPTRPYGDLSLQGPPPGKVWKIVGKASELGEEVYILDGAYYDTRVMFSPDPEHSCLTHRAHGTVVSHVILPSMGRGQARHYLREVAQFSGIADASPAAYADLAVELPPQTEVRLFRPADEAAPPGWETAAPGRSCK